MPSKITVNGIAYDSVDAMPPDVRRVYEETLAKFRDLRDRGGDGAPEIAQGDLGPVHWTTTVQKRLIVNGKAYQNEASMPPEVRGSYEQAMRAARSNDPTVKKNEIKMSFTVTGSGFTLGTGSGGPSQPSTRPLAGPGAAEPAAWTPGPTPIEPGSVVGRLRIALFLGICAVAGLALFLFTKIR